MRLTTCLIATAALLTATPARADEPTWQEVRRIELVYQGLSAVDAVQTCDFLKRGVAHELNPILGKNPKCAEVVGFKIAGGLAHWLLVRTLFKEDPKIAKWVAIGSVTIQGGVVGANLRFAF